MPKRVPGTKDSWEMVCYRCGSIRWMYSRTEPDARYTCIRCRAAIAGRKVSDPAGEDAKRKQQDLHARWAAGKGPRKNSAQKKARDHGNP
jgi:hypothetical protein